MPSPRKTISVLHVSQPTEPGVARIAADLAASQVERGWRVGIASPRAGSLLGWARAAGVRHLEWRVGRAPGPSLVVEMRRLRACLDEFRPDVVHLHASKAGLAGRLLLRGRVPTIFEPNAWSFHAVSGPVRVATRVWERRAARWSDVILCVSGAERRLGVEAGIDAEWRVIPNGIDLQSLAVAEPEDRKAARAHLELPDAPTVVCIGRLSKQKGQDLLLEAWPRILRSSPEARLYLVGDESQYRALTSRAVEHVRFVGSRSDVPDWLAAADVVAMPSRWEGCSLAMLEAMARGRCVVASDVSGADEAIGNDAGALVAVGDIDGLAGAISARLADPGRADAEGRIGRRRVEERHDLRVIAASVANLYAEVLSARGYVSV